MHKQAKKAFASSRDNDKAAKGNGGNPRVNQPKGHTATRQPQAQGAGQTMGNTTNATGSNKKSAQRHNKNQPGKQKHKVSFMPQDPRRTTPKGAPKTTAPHKPKPNKPKP